MAAMLVFMVVVAAARAMMTYPGEEMSTRQLLQMNKRDDIAFLPEDPCSRQGGICGLLEACPPNERHAPGLCPAQQQDGVECCRIVPTNIGDCQRRGGECMPAPACGNAPKDALGKCSQGDICCILLR
ncbi:U-scoloptoxin(19)-Tl1a [Procambarus clarkii]|uniref:U-scoloptoxin(19)-Tl1a n=1 Tax=Procambarus clarkii TaxID=6728 RepID=UPI001E676F91|nr:U-scoloptoxin(19)-Tl1a-like [Procambarus clarkii]